MGLRTKAQEVYKRIQSDPEFSEKVRNEYLTKKKISFLEKIKELKNSDLSHSESHFETPGPYEDLSHEDVILLEEETDIIDLDEEITEPTQESDDPVIDLDELSEPQENSEDSATPLLTEDSTLIEDPPSSPEDDLQKWEEDALKEAENDPFLSIEESVIEDIEKENLSTPIEELTVEPEVSPSGEDLESETESESIDSQSQSKLDTYLVLMEITKELVKSATLEDFFENLMYSTEGQLGPESIIIISSKQGDFDNLYLVAHDGINVEDGMVFNSGDPFFSLISNFEEPIRATDIDLKDLPEKDKNLINHPSTHIFIPIKSEDRFLGFIILGPTISGVEYSDDDLEFLSNLAEMAGNIMLKMFDSVNLHSEIDRLSDSVKKKDILTTISESFHSSKSLSEIFNSIKVNTIDILNFTQVSVYFKNNELECYQLKYSTIFPDIEIPDHKLNYDSSILNLISDPSGIFEISIDEHPEISEYKEYGQLTIVPLSSMGKILGLIFVSGTSSMEADFQRQVLHSIGSAAGLGLNGILLREEKDYLYKNPFNPLQEILEGEIRYAKENESVFSLVMVKIQNITRILNLLGDDFYDEYSGYIQTKLNLHLLPSDFYSRVGHGKFACFIRDDGEGHIEKFIAAAKHDLSKFPNAPKDFKLSIQLFTLSYPKQSTDFRKFIEIIEEA